MITGTVCYVSYEEVTMEGMARLVVSDLHTFFTYNQALHCGLHVKKPEGVDETWFLLDVAKRLGANVRAQFGIGGRHSMTAWSAKLTFVPLLGECERRVARQGEASLKVGGGPHVKGAAHQRAAACDCGCDTCIRQ